MRLALLLAALLLMMAPGPAQAADAGVWSRAPAAPATVFRVIPRSPAAELIWAKDGCWRGCAQDCGRHHQTCLQVDTSGNCMAQNAACDRFCQRACRSYGGPLLPFD